MGTIGLKIKMLFVYVILKIMSKNIEVINEKVKELVIWANGKNNDNVLLGGIGSVEVRLVKEGRGWWIHIKGLGVPLIKDRLTNGFYAFNKKTVGRLEGLFITWAGVDFKHDIDHICDYIKGFDYMCQVPEFGIFDRIRETKKEVHFTPHEDFGNYIDVRGNVARKVYGQYSLELCFKINSKFCRGFLGELVIDEIKPIDITTVFTQKEFNKSLGGLVSDYVQNVVEC